MTYEELPDISENSQELPLEFSPHDWSSFVKVVPFINLKSLFFEALWFRIKENGALISLITNWLTWKSSLYSFTFVWLSHLFNEVRKNIFKILSYSH